MKISWNRILVPLLLIWVLFAGLYGATHDSLTTDEGIHVASGYLILTRHDFRFDAEHPSLFKMLSALPLLTLHLNAPATDQELWNNAAPTFYDSWRESRGWTDLWFFKSGNPTDLMVLLMRIPAVLCLVGLSAFIYFLTRKWFGDKVALFSLFFTAFNPNLLAHGHLANDDVPVALTALFLIYGVWLYAKESSRKHAIIVGLLLGLSFLVKYSALVFAPLVVGWVIALSYHKGRRLEGIIHYLLIALTTLLTLWIGYFGHSEIIPGSSLFGGAASIDHLLRAVHLNYSILSHIIPIDWLKGFLIVRDSAVAGRQTYLLGHVYPSGIWYYFPVVYVLKTQIVGTLLLTAGAVSLYRQRSIKHAQNLAHWVLGTTVGVTLFISMVNRLDIGIRHILILLVIAGIYQACMLVQIQKTTPFRWLSPLIIILFILPVTLQFKNLLGFRSEIVQPASRTWWYFSDSNLDWGQQAKDIAWVVETQFKNERIYCNYPWSPYALSHYGVDAQPFIPASPPTRGIAVLTATQLSGKDYQGYFLHKTPIAHIANDTYFYRLD